jgi:hypothetical protein
VEESTLVVGSVPDAPSRDSSTGQVCGIVCDQAAPLRQKRKYMSKRSGQSGSVRLIGTKWYGRYWRDVAGKKNVSIRQ